MVDETFFADMDDEDEENAREQLKQAIFGSGRDRDPHEPINWVDED